MDIEKLTNELREQRVIIEKIYISTEKTRKYFLWTFWVTVIALVLPLLGMVVAIPYFISTMSSALSGAGLGI